MRDATANADTAQLLEDRIDRTAHVQDHRQVVTPRQLELRDEKIELAGGVDVGDEVIETDLADCPRRAAHKVRFERIEVVLAGPHDVQRMNAERRADIPPPRSQGKHRVETAPIHRRHDEALHARGTRAVDHLVAVRCKLGRVEMNMRVDQHRNPPPQGDAMVNVP